MPAVAIANAGGFVAWHTRCAALAAGLDVREIRLGRDNAPDSASTQAAGVDDYVHFSSPSATARTNATQAQIASQSASVVRRASEPPRRVTHVTVNPWGSKAPRGRALDDDARVLSDAAVAVGAVFRRVELPHVFGEFGSPAEDALVAGAIRQLAAKRRTTMAADTRVELMHAQDAADAVLSELDPSVTSYDTSVREVITSLARFDADDRSAEIPELDGGLDGRLYATYLAAALANRPVRPYVNHADHRGSLVEAFRIRGGQCQVTLSTTVPGQTRASHWHRRKIEILAPVSGRMEVSVRRLFGNETQSFVVDGARPAAVIVPPLTVHEIRSVGDQTLVLAYWSDQLHCAVEPDTFPPEAPA